MPHRAVVVDRELCNPKKCPYVCAKVCPGVRMEEETVVPGPEGFPLINETLCTGCGICTKKCPFRALSVVNLPQELTGEKVHQYGPNQFRLYRLPAVEPGRVIGLVGKNGIGKTTVVNILSGVLRPNLGLEEKPDWSVVLDHFGGTSLKDHLRGVTEGRIRVSIKPQTVYQLARVWSGDGRSLLHMVDEKGAYEFIVKELDLDRSVDKRVGELSGGELQRLAVAVAYVKEADFYFFDEPSSYNDVFQRMKVARLISRLAREGKGVLVVEHDLSILDYLSDFVYVFYGAPGVYGIVSHRYSTRVGINAFLDGYLPAENVMFRREAIRFEVHAPSREELSEEKVVEFGDLTKSYVGFMMRVSAGSIRKGEILGVVGANALGKTTFLEVISGIKKPEEGDVYMKAKISYKPQYLSTSYHGSVRELLEKVADLSDPWAQEVVASLDVERMYEKEVRTLSGGESQRLAITICLLKEADIYALDEPSAFLDAEERVRVARIIRKLVKAGGKAAIVVDHDVQIVDVVSDSMMIFSGVPAESGRASVLPSKEDGMNTLLMDLGITYRRDAETGRPRINKPGSKLDRLQRRIGAYYYVARGGVEE